MTVAHRAHSRRRRPGAPPAALLTSSFDDLTDDDWEHALGGMHALVWDGRPS